MITVHLVRHGEVHNPDGVLYGRLPGFGLSELGVRQARATADWFSGRDIAHLVSSPLERAQQTAAPLAAATGLSVEIDDRLIEAANKLQGRPVAGGRRLFRDPANWRFFVNPLQPSWGEPYSQIADRMLAAVCAARDAVPDGGEAVCVSHQLPVVCARRRAEGVHLAHDPRHRQCGLASVTSLTFADDTVVFIDYAEPAADLPPGQGTGA